MNLLPAFIDNLATNPTNNTDPAINFLNNTAQATAPVTGAASTILGLTTIFFALGIAAAGLEMVVGALRSAGVLEEKVEKIKYKHGIDHYKDVRDKLSTRRKKDEE
jgi:NADP-dependent 3-hydroxy acid dehydrogenase YdfG